MRKYPKFAYPKEILYWERKAMNSYTFEKHPPNRKERKRRKMTDRKQWLAAHLKGHTLAEEFLLTLMSYNVVFAGKWE